jgi:hypothetical protein
MVRTMKRSAEQLRIILLMVCGVALPQLYAFTDKESFILLVISSLCSGLLGLECLHRMKNSD